MSGERMIARNMLQIRTTLPTGLQVVEVEQVDERAPALQTQVLSAEYEVTLTEPVDTSELKRKVDTVIETKSIPRERRGKTYDLRPLIEELTLTPAPPSLEGRLRSAPSGGDGVRVFMKLAAREGATGRPEEVLDVLGIAFEETRIERTRLIFQS